MPDALRVALATYRGNPQSGGQGVYTHYLSRELAALGHSVTVFSGQPYPVLADGVRFEAVPSLDLYRADHPFRVLRLGHQDAVQRGSDDTESPTTEGCGLGQFLGGPGFAHTLQDYTR